MQTYFRTGQHKQKSPDISEANSTENLTNRSPYPILHIIREQSLEKALAKMASPDETFKRNIQTMNGLSTEKIKTLFPYLHIS